MKKTRLKLTELKNRRTKMEFWFKMKFGLLFGF